MLLRSFGFIIETSSLENKNENYYLNIGYAQE